MLKFFVNKVVFRKLGSPPATQKFNCVKHKWDDSTAHCTLEAGPASLYLIEKNGHIKKRFDYRLIQGFTEVTDVNGGFCVVYESHS